MLCPASRTEKSSTADTPAISAVPIKLMHFSPLDGTKAEVRAIEKLYHDHFGKAGITTLVRSEASKRAFLNAAPKYRYLHLATHGFFLSQDAGILGLLMKRSEAGGRHPALLSGWLWPGKCVTEVIHRRPLMMAFSPLKRSVRRAWRACNWWYFRRARLAGRDGCRGGAFGVTTSVSVRWCASRSGQSMAGARSTYPTAHGAVLREPVA